MRTHLRTESVQRPGQAESINPCLLVLHLPVSMPTTLIVCSTDGTACVSDPLFPTFSLPQGTLEIFPWQNLAVLFFFVPTALSLAHVLIFRGLLSLQAFLPTNQVPPTTVRSLYSQISCCCHLPAVLNLHTSAHFQVLQNRTSVLLAALIFLVFLNRKPLILAHGLGSCGSTPSPS